MSTSTSPTPPLLFTKRLNAFLQSHHHPSHLPTLLLTTTHGKILAHASSQPVSSLRTHATVAASLLAIHTSSSVAIPTALPGSRTPPDLIPSSPTGSDDGDDDEDDDEDARSQNSDFSGPRRRRDDSPRAGRERRGSRAAAQARTAIQPGTITVQLTGGTVVIRRLNCGLLFVCVGPPASADIYSANEPSDSHLHPPPTHHRHHNHYSPPAVVGSPSEADSLVSAGGQTSASSIEGSHAGPVAAMRRRVAELARRLDEKLGTLKVPGEGVGIE